MSRVTPADIEANIASEHYFTAEEGALWRKPRDNRPFPLPESLSLLTICVLVLKNGFTVVGKSACADPAIFDAEIGKKVAREDAVRQVWPLLGYELRSRLHAQDSYGGTE
jgi:hypothetical protein